MSYAGREGPNPFRVYIIIVTVLPLPLAIRWETANMIAMASTGLLFMGSL